MLAGIGKSLIPVGNSGDSLFARSNFAAGTAGKEGTKKDLDLECDYPNRRTFNSIFFRTLYDYVGPATRAVNVYPAETWKAIPAVYETNNKRTTPFEKRWWDLTDDPNRNPYVYLARLDESSLIGRYGTLLIGLDDGVSDLSQPASPVLNGQIQPDGKKRDVTYMRVFDESNCQVKTLDMDEGSWRNGQPEYYEITTTDALGSSTGNVKRVIHWTRMLHAAWKVRENEAFASSILQNLVPYIWDIRKVGGGSAEMYWQGAFPGISFETMPEMITEGGNVELDEESVKEQVQKYMLKLQRYMALTGVSAKSLATQVSDPTPHLKCAIDLLCMALDVPVPVFLGQQEGHLASLANKGMWFDKISGRRNGYVTPKLIRPMVSRFADLGIVPKPSQVITEWTDPNTQSDSDKANVALKRTQAFSQWASTNARFAVDQLTFLTDEMGYSDAKAKEIISRLTTQKDVVPENILNPPVKTAGGNQTGKSSKGKSSNGRPKGTVSKS